MRTPKTKRTAITQAVISSLTGETLPIKKKRKAFGHLLTQALPALAVVSLFAPSTVLADEFIFNNNSSAGTGFVIDGALFDSDGETRIYDGDTTTDADSVIGIKDEDSAGASGAKVTFDSSTADTIYGGRSTDAGSASSNTVTVQNGSTIYRVYGGYVTGDGTVGGEGEGLGNTVVIAGSTVSTTTSGTTTYGGTVYGGFSDGSGAVSGNSVTIESYTDEGTGVTTTSEVAGTVYGGYNSGSGKVSSNTVTVDNSSAANVYGGHSSTGAANSNTVTISGGSEILYDSNSSDPTGYVYGGYANTTGSASENKVYVDASYASNVTGGHSGGTGDANSNYVEITGSQISTVTGTTDTGYVYGGYTSGSGSASENKVYVTGSSAGNVYGGHSGTGTADSNEVYITGSTITGDVYGAHAVGTDESENESASSNKVEITDSSVENFVYGGRVSGIKGDASGNTVTVTSTDSGTSTVAGDVIGGYISDGYGEVHVDAVGDTTGNTVTISGKNTTVTGNVLGGENYGSGSASSNKVEITYSSVENNVYGGRGIYSGKADENTVTITSGSITGRVYGGDAVSSSASKNEVYITSGTTVGADVYGGHSNSDAVTEENTVEITDSTISAAVSGGYTEAGKSASSNEVSVKNSSAGYIVGGRVGSGAGDAKGNTVTVTSSGATSVYGGETVNGSADGNTVIVQGGTEEDSGSTISSNVYGGYGGSASSNIVIFSDSSASNVYGGNATTGDATGNTVTITSGTTIYTGSSGTGSVYGGNTVNGKADGNTVIVQGGSEEGSGSDIGYRVYGGYTTGSGEGSASSNTVTFTDSSADSVYGGGTGNNSYGATDGNTVTVTNSKITNEIYGGLSQRSTASGNTVKVNNSSAAYVIGGRVRNTASTGAAESNTVTVTSESEITNVIGGLTQGSGDASSNTVSIDSSSVNGAIYGGVSTGTGTGDATGNTVILKDTTVTASETQVIPGVGDPELSAIYGGRSSGGEKASSNTVTITGGTITSDIYGGLSEAGTASTNTVTIGSAETTVKGSIYGGVGSGSGEVSNNTVTLNDGKITGDIFAAGYSTGSGKVSDNVFNINGGTLSGGFTYGGYSGSGGSVSDNTINLNGGTVSGTLYAGYSEGGTPKNNTINLDGDSSDRTGDKINVENAILYGSNLAQATGSNGNTLNIQNFSGKIGNIGVFDNVNLDLSGIDLANAVYGSGSVIILTDSAGEGTNFTNSTVNIYNSSSSYSLAVGFTSESELSDEYTIFANANGDMTKTNATINEKIMVVQDPDKYPNLIAYSEYDLSSDDDGTISYILNPETAGTYVPNEGRTVTALAGAGAKLSMYYAQLDDLRKRLGEVRYGAQDGIWARFIYQQDSFAGTSSYDAKQRWYGLNVGLDRLVSQDEDRMWLLGANFKYGHAKQKVTQSLGGKGNLNSYGVNLYATYANQYGCYADFVVTFDDYHQKLGVKTGDTSSSSGDYSSWGWGASIELGKMFSTKQNDENWGPWHNHWWVEPQAQLSYYWLKGKDFVMSSGKDVSQNNGQSLVGRLGLVVGKHWSYGGANKVDKRYVQVYLKGGVKHEFLGKQDLRYAGKLYNDRLRGTTGYYGAGVDWNLTKQVKAYAQVERESGGKYKKDIEASIGLKWQF